MKARQIPAADPHARELARRRAISIVTSRAYFPLRTALLEAVNCGRLGAGDLAMLSDRELLERAGISVAIDAVGV